MLNIFNKTNINVANTDTNIASDIVFCNITYNM